MAIPAKFLDDLRARASLVDIVGRRVKLTRRGTEYLGLCPFHHEKSPSFTVSEEKGFYHCFAYFSISCSQKLAVRFQLYFSSTASRVATGYMASAAVPSVKLLQSLYFLFGFDMS